MNKRWKIDRDFTDLDVISIGSDDILVDRSMDR